MLNSGGSRADVRNGFAWSAEFQLKVKGISPYSPPNNGVVPPDGVGFGFDSTSNRINSPAFAYDAAGNQTRALIPGSSTNSQRFQYDAANRLVKVKNDSGTTIAVYTYGDSNERLISQDGDENSNYRTYYVGEGGSVTAEYTETPSSPTTPLWSKSYVYLGNRLLSTLTPNGSGGEAVEYDHPDRLGTRLITNPATGSASEQVTLPFGTALAAESSGTPTKRRFTSYDRSDTTGLDYAYNRHYDPQQGRFTQVDPAGMSATSLVNPQTLNLFAYCTNDPINHIDPSGLGFFSKLWHAIKKIITSKWFMIAVAIAIILIAHYYPHSIFGALGGGSHAGGAAPFAHGAGATTGLGAAAGGEAAGGWTAAELAAAASSTGWVSSSGVAIMVSHIAVTAASSGIATAVSLALAGALGAGLATHELGHSQTTSKCDQKIASTFGGPGSVAATVTEPSTLLHPAAGINRFGHLAGNGSFHIYTNAQGTPGTVGLYTPRGWIGKPVTGVVYQGARDPNPGEVNYNFMRFTYPGGLVISFVHVANPGIVARDLNALGSIRIGNIGGPGGTGLGYNHSHVNVYKNGQRTDPRNVFCK